MDRKKRNIHRKGTDPAFRTVKIKKYKRDKPENKEMTDIKNPFPLFAYERKEHESQAVPGHGEGGGGAVGRGKLEQTRNGRKERFFSVCLTQ